MKEETHGELPAQGLIDTAADYFNRHPERNRVNALFHWETQL